MNIPVNKLRGLLHKIMYKDVATIYRSVKVKDEKTGVSDFTFQLVYEELPCKLSQYGKELSAHRDDRAQHITEDLRLTCDPEIEILENDVADVIHEGETFKLVAGTSFNYPTHKEISMRRRKEAKQK